MNLAEPDQRRPWIKNKGEVAEWFGVSLPTVDAWVRNDCPVIVRGGRGVQWQLDVRDVQRWRERGPDSSAQDIDPDSMTPKEQLDYWRAQQEKRKNAIGSGEVIYSDEARAAMATLIKATMLTLDTLTENLERKARLTPDQAAEVERIVDGQRRTLHADLNSHADDQGNG